MVSACPSYVNRHPRTLSDIAAVAVALNGAGRELCEQGGGPGFSHSFPVPNKPHGFRGINVKHHERKAPNFGFT